MPACQSKYLGDVIYGDDAVIAFAAGIPGFEQEKRFILLAAPDLHPIVFMQSLATPDLCFTAIPALSVIADYNPSISGSDLERLGFLSGKQPVIGKDVACLAILHFGEEATTVNLRAPIVINLRARRGVQAIAPEDRYSHRHELRFEEVGSC